MNLDLSILINLSEQKAVRDVLRQHEASDKMTGWTSLTTVGTQEKRVQPSNPVGGKGLYQSL